MVERGSSKNGRQLNGKIQQVLPRSLYRVVKEDGGLVLCHVSLSVRTLVGRLLEGDEVLVELSEYDPKRGRIIEHRPSSPR